MFDQELVTFQRIGSFVWKWQPAACTQKRPVKAALRVMAKAEAAEQSVVGQRSTVPMFFCFVRQDSRSVRKDLQVRRFLPTCNLRCDRFVEDLAGQGTFCPGVMLMVSSMFGDRAITANIRWLSWSIQKPWLVRCWRGHRGNRVNQSRRNVFARTGPRRAMTGPPAGAGMDHRAAWSNSTQRRTALMRAAAPRRLAARTGSRLVKPRRRR